MRDEGEPNDRPRPRRARPVRRTSIWPWIIVVGGGILLLIPAAYLGAPLIGKAFKIPPANQPATYTVMTVEQLVAEWEANPVAAAEKYKFNGIEITGRLHRIDSNLSRQIYIDVRGEGQENRHETHIFVLEAKPKDGLAKCIVGKRVVVKARSAGEANRYPWLIADDIRPLD